MSAVNIRSRLFSLLAKEFESFIPQFKPYTTDYQMVAYSSKDLETWLRVKMGIDDSREIYRKVEDILRENPNNFKTSLSFWASMWLRKWKERVRILLTKFEEPRDHVERVKRARRILQEMEWRDELRSMVIKKLVEHVEICMTEFIADNLVIEEIARRLQRTDKDSVVALDPLSIYNAVSSRIIRLSRERGPLVYLNIKPGLFQHYNY
ncbi:MAG: hypothetical protein QXH24_00315 [Candidatus Bathyarchaeia archaeon]